MVGLGFFIWNSGKFRNYVYPACDTKLFLHIVWLVIHIHLARAKSLNIFSI